MILTVAWLLFSPLQYDSDFIEWYGLKIHEAVLKMEFENEKACGAPQPLKVQYRQEFLEELRDKKWVTSKSD